MRFLSTMLDRFCAAIDSRIDRAVARVILRDKSVLAEQVAESYRHLVEASVTPAQVADQMAVKKVAQYVDMDELADHIADRLDLDTSAICSSVAGDLDMDDLADHVADKVDIDTSEIARNVARNLDMDDVILRLKDEIDTDALNYEALAKALLRCFAKSIVKS